MHSTDNEIYLLETKHTAFVGRTFCEAVMAAFKVSGGVCTCIGVITHRRSDEDDGYY
jgi:hypothetical protein